MLNTVKFQRPLPPSTMKLFAVVIDLRDVAGGTRIGQPFPVEGDISWARRRTASEISKVIVT